MADGGQSGPSLWRTTTFRLTILLGLVFAVSIVALLGLVEWRTRMTLTWQADVVLRGEVDALRATSPEALPGRIRFQLANDVRHINHYGLFSREGEAVAGDVAAVPSGLARDDSPQDAPTPRGGVARRVIAARLPWGERLVVERDVSFLHPIQRIIFDALVWSGGLIAALGLGAGVLLSLGPLARLRGVQVVSARIIEGDLAARMPVSRRRDELDFLSTLINGMLAEIERLLDEVKTRNDAVAHNMRTPLTRVRARLAQALDAGDLSPLQQERLEASVADFDAVLDRFRALLRVSEIEAKARQSGFGPVDLRAVVAEVIDLYTPLAEELGLTLGAKASTAEVRADGALLVEALSALIANALKFSPSGNHVEIELSSTLDGPRLSVTDDGPGIPVQERELVLRPFQRGIGAGGIEGSGLGLAIVAAIARLHRYKLSLHDAEPGLRVTLDCWPSG